MTAEKNLTYTRGRSIRSWSEFKLQYLMGSMPNQWIDKAPAITRCVYQNQGEGNFRKTVTEDGSGQKIRNLDPVNIAIC